MEILFNEELDNQILVQIPRSNFFLLGEKMKDNSYDVSVVNKIKFSKRSIQRNVSQRSFAKLVAKTLAHPEQEMFKHKRTLTDHRDYYKSLLKEFGQSH